MTRSDDRDRLFRSASENDFTASFRSVLSSCQVNNIGNLILRLCKVGVRSGAKSGHGLGTVWAKRKVGVRSGSCPYLAPTLRWRSIKLP